MSGKFHQWLTAMACAFGSLVFGSICVWPSYTSVLYTSNTTILEAPMTQSEEALLGSLPSLGAMAGTVVAGPIIDWMGRKNGGVLLSLPALISWVIIGVSSNKMILLVSRFISGIPGGAFVIVPPIFISEVCEDSIRGALASTPMFLYTLGTVISCIMGWFMSYQTIIWMNVMLSVIATLLCMIVVESPVYLLRKRRDEDARAAMGKYRGVPANSLVVSDELLRLKQQAMPALEFVAVPGSQADGSSKQVEAELNTPEKMRSMSPLKSLFLMPESRRAFIIVFTLMAMQVLMGIVPVQVYAKTVFDQTDPANADLYAVLYGLMQVIGAGVSTFITDKAGRRILLISSSILVFICLTALGFLIGSARVPAWVTVSLILIYCFSFMLGAGTIPYVLLTEVFVPEVQSIASMIIVEWIWFLNFAIIGVFPYMLNAFGINGSFLIFAVVAGFSVVFSYFTVPETKGLSIDEIQNLFTGKKKP